MASIANDPNGRRRILFVAPDGIRRAIRLGKCDRKTAENVCRHVESLLASRLSGQPVERQTAVWLADIGEGLRDKLAAVGLAEAEKKNTVAEFLSTWLAGKEASGFSPNSLRAWGQTARELADLLGETRLVKVEHADAERYRVAMQERRLRPTTIHKRLGHARQMFADAILQGEATTNPFDRVRQRQGDPCERRAYVSVTVAQQVIEQCPNVHWRLLVALARFAGLRTPSEPFALTWDLVNWERGRITIPSPKTASRGKGHRVIPIFPLLRPHLEAAWDAAEEGATHIFPPTMRRSTNLRTQLVRIVNRAGVEEWPRIWHNLRASCESDLASAFPLATVTKWLGNTPSVALRHYVDPTDSAFDLAQAWSPGGAESGALVAQNAAQSGAAPICTNSQADGASGVQGTGSFRPVQVDSSPCDSEQKCTTGVYGNRTTAETAEKHALFEMGGAQSGAVAHILALIGALGPEDRERLRAQLNNQAEAFDS